jgi:two-component system, NarL family, sensor histidine kinase UhpB
LSNAVRHAGPDLVAISIERLRDEVKVAITDDGPGMREPSRLGYGLVGIDERVSAIGGRLTFSNKSGEGFTVMAVLPFPIAAPLQTAEP